MAVVLAASTEGCAVVAAPALLLPVRACPRHRRHARLPRAPSDSPGQKLVGALLDAAVFVALVAVVTFVLVALYYYRCTGFLKNYMRFSAFFVLFSMGGAVLAVFGPRAGWSPPGLELAGRRAPRAGWPPRAPG